MIALRIMSGGSPIDMDMLFDMSFGHIYWIFHQVIEKWFLNDCFYPIDGVGSCSDNCRMEEVALQFSEVSNSVIEDDIDGEHVAISMEVVETAAEAMEMIVMIIFL